MLLNDCLPVLLVWLCSLLYYTFAKDTSEGSFRQCLIANPSETLGYCLGVGTIAKLQALEDEPDFSITDKVKFLRDEQQYRESYNFVETDPGNLRSIFDSIQHVFSKRNLLWDMSYIYPGLSMRLAPSFNTGGELEFALDQHRETLNQQHLKEVGTGRLLARQYLVPLLLGLKFNTASLLPIVFGAIAFLVGKAAIISKFAFIFSSAYALSKLVFNSQDSCSPIYQQPPLNPAFGGHYDLGYKTEEHAEPYFKNRNILPDQLQLHGNIPVDEVFTREDKSVGRNFAWSENEHKRKS